MNTPLQEWANVNRPAEDLIYREGFWDQIMFVRDRLSYLFMTSQSTADFVKANMVVISTHRSKSVTLPVFQMTLPSGIVLTLRYNFYNWKISVLSPDPIGVDFLGLFDVNESINSVYCEGFPKDRVYGSFADNPAKFTCEIRDNYRLFTFCWLLANSK